MNGSFIDDFADVPGLNDLNAQPSTPAKAAKPRETFPCESCGGTGVYRGVRIHQQETRCFACGGKGYFLKSYKDRMASREKYAQKKATALATAQAAFNEAHPGLIEAMTPLASWNDFVKSLLDQYLLKGGLSDRQVTAAISQVEKAARRDAERAAQKAARIENAPQIDMTSILAMFEKARENGLKKLAFVAADLRISLAKSTSVNAGALYVQRDGDYQGKIMGGKFLAIREAKADTAALLIEIAKNPSQAARDYGKRTGTCCCCGRELTDPKSIADGIGPICATNWGL